MDWELYDRYRASAVLAAILLVCILQLAFQQSAIVVRIKSVVVYLTLPLHRAFIHREEEGLIPSVTSASIVMPVHEAERSRALSVLSDENDRLHDLLDLKKHRWPQGVAAHIVSRQPLRWFKDLSIDQGSRLGISIDDAVISRNGGQEALLGRIVEVHPEVSRVMLVQDPLSAVPASVAGEKNEDGVVEGTGSHLMIMKYLSRDSRAKIGDLVLTSGLGGVFPPGLALGRVESIGPDDRQLFLEAKIRPIEASGDTRMVMVLVHPQEEKK